MSIYNLNLSIGTIGTITRTFIDILLIWFVIYYALKLVTNSTRTQQYFKGIIIIIALDMVAKFLGLTTVSFATSLFVNWGFLALIILFQPEIRHVLENLGTSNFFSRLAPLSGNEKENLVDSIVAATMLLSRDQTGALISIEQGSSLSDYIKTGTPLNSLVTAELLTSLFVTSTPLHDGAVIIQGDRIACASAYFPPTNLELPNKYGARHRAAIGISEITDCVTVVVSEETGNVSITQNGTIIPMNSRKDLRNYLLRVICGEETEIKATPRRTEPEASIKLPKKPVQTEKASERMENTSVLSKLAIKKQGEVVKQEPKIEAESVVVNNTEVKPAAVETPKPALKSEPVVQKPVVQKPEPVRVEPEIKPTPVQPVYTPADKNVSVMGFGPANKPAEKETVTSSFDVDKIFGSADVNHKFDMVDNISMSGKSDASKGRGNH